jgi:tetratricopeptide (TPR) repeat protein
MNRLASLALFLAVSALRLSAAESVDALLQQGRLHEAESALEARVLAAPDDAGARHTLGRLLLRRREYEPAIPHLAKAAELQPHNAAYQFHHGAACVQHADTLGKTLRALGMARRGRAAMEKAAALEPGNVEFHEGLIEFYLRAPGIAGGGLEKARTQAETLRRLDPRAGAIALAMVHLRAKENPAAFALYEAWLAQAPDDYQVLYLTGRAAADTGLQMEKGAAALRRCLQLAPPPRTVSHATVNFHLARILQQQGDLEGARAAYLAALDQEPAHAAAEAALRALD